MRSHVIAAAATLLLLSVFTTGCEDTITVATEGSEIILAASPSNIDTLNAQGEGVSNIRATVLNANGIPEKGVTVFFSTNAGTLDSADEGGTDETDDNGVARDRLITSQSAQVTAQSGGATKQVTVTVSGQQLVGSVNLQADGPTQIMSGQSVSFTVTVLDTFGLAIDGQLVTVTTPVGNGIVDTTPNGGGPLLTDSFGIAKFDLLQVTIFPTQVVASAGGLSSIEVEITEQ